MKGHQLLSPPQEISAWSVPALDQDGDVRSRALQGPGLCHPAMDVTFQSTAGEGRGQNKTSPKVKPSLNLTASLQGPAAPARRLPGFLLSLLSW